MLKAAVSALVFAAAQGRPQLPADVSAAACPNYPLCSFDTQDLSVFTPAQQVIPLLLLHPGPVRIHPGPAGITHNSYISSKTKRLYHLRLTKIVYFRFGL